MGEDLEGTSAIVTARSDAAGEVLTVVAGRLPLRQAHPFADVPGFP
jgi:hypothetical protein